MFSPLATCPHCAFSFAKIFRLFPIADFPPVIYFLSRIAPCCQRPSCHLSPSLFFFGVSSSARYRGFTRRVFPAVEFSFAVADFPIRLYALSTVFIARRTRKHGSIVRSEKETQARERDRETREGGMANVVAQMKFNKISSSLVAFGRSSIYSLSREERAAGSVGGHHGDAASRTP